MNIILGLTELLKEQPYKVVCGACDKELEVELTEVDKDLDMIVTVVPCLDCIESAVEESKEV